MEKQSGVESRASRWDLERGRVRRVLVESGAKASTVASAEGEAGIPPKFVSLQQINTRCAAQAAAEEERKRGC